MDNHPEICQRDCFSSLAAGAAPLNKDTGWFKIAPVAMCACGMWHTCILGPFDIILRFLTDKKHEGNHLNV